MSTKITRFAELDAALDTALAALDTANAALRAIVGPATEHHDIPAPRAHHARRSTPAPAATEKPKRRMSRAARQAISERMRRYWKTYRAAEKKAGRK